ncbi:MAG: hypothetical protein KGN77_09550 [Xanthomonadaceae bacterium]|nr:hypothetical protein [Xanthomonadaceae bacterium]MDE1965314.1 hypothetical protein [Xanthomonadaceae bacterium]
MSWWKSLRLSHVLIATLLVIVFVLVKIVWFARPAMGGTGGQTRFTVRIDPAAAARIRSWRQAQGLDPAPVPGAVAAPTQATSGSSLAAFVQACGQSGHQPLLQDDGGQVFATCQ